MMRQPTSLDSQIGALEHAISQAHRLDASRARADLLKRQLEDALTSLKVLRRYQPAVRAAIDAERQKVATHG